MDPGLIAGGLVALLTGGSEVIEKGAGHYRKKFREWWLKGDDSPCRMVPFDRLKIAVIFVQVFAEVFDDVLDELDDGEGQEWQQELERRLRKRLTSAGYRQFIRDCLE